MYIREKTSPRSKSTSLQVCESYREDGKPRSKVLLTLGPKDYLLQSGQLDKLINSLTKFTGLNTDAFFKDDLLEETCRFNWGVPSLLGQLWEAFGLENFFKEQKLKVKFDLNQIVFRQMVDRFLKPRSKLSFYENQNDYLGFNEDLELHHIYRSLSSLAKLKPSLEKHLFDINRNIFNMKVDIVFFDATTIYFHSDKADDLRKFGFSKDCKFNDVQIVMGLLMDEDGRPIGFESFPGNTFDGKTLIKSLESLKQNFQIEKLILVGDRGICSKVNLEEIKKLGYEYIVATSLKKQSREMQKEVLNEEGYESINNSDLEDEIKYKTININEERLIATWSSKRAKKDFYDREIFIEKAKEILEEKSNLKKPGKAKYLAMEQKVKYLDEAKIIEDEKWDGYYGIQTNNLKMSQEAVYEAYHQLWKIEDCFRVLKSHLKIRPVFLWNPERIEGHLTLCFLTFVFERHMEIELRKKGIETSPAKIRVALEKLQASILKISNRKVFSVSPIGDEAKKIFEALDLQMPKPNQIKNQLKQTKQYKS